MEKTRDELIQVGAYIESKNNFEFTVRIVKIEGSKVTVRWSYHGIDDEDENAYRIINKSDIRVYEDGSGLYVPNWTIRW